MDHLGGSGYPGTALEVREDGQLGGGIKYENFGSKSGLWHCNTGTGGGTCGGLHFAVDTNRTMMMGVRGRPALTVHGHFDIWE